MGLGEKGEGIKKKSYRHRQQCGDYQRSKGMGEVKEGIGGQMMMGGYLTLGGEHIVQYTDDIL